ncbi:MAG: aminoacyl-tRNA hydrolase [Bdellovibrionales bacterium]|nr:aminoacyl-tRNA hydrolase [Bdellovibrionales bacterium]
MKIPEHELEFTYARSSGPGGQNVNKVNSKAILRWNVMTTRSLRDDVKARFIERFGARLNDFGEIVIQSDRHRDQPQNRDDCIEKLQEMIALVLHPPKKRKKSKPTRSSQKRRRESKRLHSEKKASRRRNF